MLGSLLAGLISGETALAVKRARRAAVFYAVAGVFLACGIGFLIGAAYIWTAARYGALEAALGFGGGFVLLALLVLLVHRLGGRSRAKKAADRRRADLTSLGVTAAVAVLPVLLRNRTAVGALTAAAASIAALYVIRENTPDRDDPDA